MRFFHLMLVFVCAAFMPLRAQTIQKYVRVYPDGSLDTIWQVRNQDTFLIETFWRNGTSQTQSWHQDSIYYFNDEGQIKSKLYQPLHYLCPQWIEALSSPFTYITLNVQQKVVFYPNGKLQNRGYWLGDSLYMYQEWLPNGILSEQIHLRQKNTTTFESVYLHELRIDKPYTQKIY